MPEGNDLSHLELLKYGAYAFVFLLGLIIGLWKWTSSIFQRDHVHRDEFEVVRALLTENKEKLAVIEARQQDVRQDVADIKTRLGILDDKIEDMRRRFEAHRSQDAAT